MRGAAEKRLYLAEAIVPDNFRDQLWGEKITPDFSFSNDQKELSSTAPFLLTPPKSKMLQGHLNRLSQVQHKGCFQAMWKR